MRKHLIATLILISLVGAHAQGEDLESNPQAERRTTLDGKLLTLISVSYASAIYDTQTTLTTLKQCAVQCFEANPLVRPFTGRNASAYAYTMGLTSVSAFATYRLKKTGARWWWVPLVATSAVHVAAAIHNEKIRSSVVGAR